MGIRNRFFYYIIVDFFINIIILYISEVRMFDLTKRQFDILTYISDFKKDNDGLSPTYRDMADKFEITVKGISDHLDLIEKKGYIERSFNKTGIKIIKKEFIVEDYGRKSRP